MITEYKLERVPMNGLHSKAKYPFRIMRIGDSFFVPNKVAEKASSSAYSAGKRLGFKFKVKKAIEAGVVGIRIFRVSEFKKDIK